MIYDLIILNISDDKLGPTDELMRTLSQRSNRSARSSPYHVSRQARRSPEKTAAKGIYILIIMNFLSDKTLLNYNTVMKHRFDLSMLFIFRILNVIW